MEDYSINISVKKKSNISSETAETVNFYFSNYKYMGTTLIECSNRSPKHSDIYQSLTVAERKNKTTIIVLYYCLPILTIYLPYMHEYIKRSLHNMFILCKDILYHRHDCVFSVKYGHFVVK